MKAIYGWKKLMPLAGRDVIRVFCDPDAGGMLKIMTVADEQNACNIDELCHLIKSFIADERVYSPVIAYDSVDPLTIIDDVEFVMEELASYNSVNSMEMMHSTYIETNGGEPDKFSRITRYAPEYIGIKFTVPKPGDNSDRVEDALGCLNRAIYDKEVVESERYLIIILNDDSDINRLYSYFEIIRDGLGSDDRYDFAPGGALAAFDVLIRPNCSSVKKVLDAYQVLKDPQIKLSQQVFVETHLIK